MDEKINSTILYKLPQNDLQRSVSDLYTHSEYTDSKLTSYIRDGLKQKKS